LAVSLLDLNFFVQLSVADSYNALKARGEYIRTQVPFGKNSIDIALPVYHIAIECDGEAYAKSPR
jgi:hypothetical protein